MTASDVRELGNEFWDEDSPEGWLRPQLGEVIWPSKEKMEPGERPRSKYLGLEHIEARTSRILGNGWASDVKSTKAVFRAGDVLYGKLRPYLNKVAIPDFDGVCSTDFLVFDQKPWLNNKFILWFLLRREVVEYANHHSTGVELPRISYDQLASLDFLLPPLAEQKRIVAAVEECVNRIKNASGHLSQVPTILKRFRQAVLGAACSGRLTEDWRRQHPETAVALGEVEGFVKTRRGVPDEVELPDNLAEVEIPTSWALKSVAFLLRTGVLKDVKDGNHGSNHPKTSELGDHGLPFITAAQVKNYKIDYDGAPKVTGAPLERLKVGFAEKEDVVLTHKGTVGRAAVNTTPCVLTPQTTYYRCNPSVLESNYLVYLLTSPFFYSQLAAIMSQTTRDFVPISEQYRLFLIVPPAQEQKEISRRVSALFTAVDKVQQAFENTEARLDRLSQSVLAKAFRGELVPTEAELARREGRNYEPASVLLERIRAGRENQVKSPQVSKHKSKKSTTLVGA